MLGLDGVRRKRLVVVVDRYFWFLDDDFHISLSRALEAKRYVEGVARDERLLQVDEHQVLLLAVPQLDFASGGQVNGRDLTRHHDVVFEPHFVQLNARRNRTSC